MTNPNAMNLAEVHIRAEFQTEGLLDIFRRKWAEILEAEFESDLQRALVQESYKGQLVNLVKGIPAVIQDPEFRQVLIDALENKWGV